MRKYILLYCMMGLSLPACKLNTSNKAALDLREAGIENVAGAIVSTSSVNLTFTGIAISSPVVVVTVKAFDKNNSPIVSIDKMDITLYRDQSRSSWLLWVLLSLLLGNFVVLVLHLRRIK